MTATCWRPCGPAGYTLGGEQSGHVVLLDHATTGDGVLTALQLLAQGRGHRPVAARPGRGHGPAAAGPGQRPRASTARGSTARRRWPTRSPGREAELGSTGRVLLRPSGTEPLVRVMVEAVTAEQAQAVADRLAGDVRSALA